MDRYKGKYSTKKRLPMASWLLIMLAVLSLSTGTAVAYLAASTDPVTNKFVAETPVDPTISETFQNNVKSNVSVNVGNPGYAVYVRAAIVATWKDSDGNVLPLPPVLGTDYALSLNTDPNVDGTYWVEKDGYYYYSQSVNSGNTDVLIEECKPLKAAPEPGYTLSVEIIAQTIQALGTTDDTNQSAVTNAWGYTPET